MHKVTGEERRRQVRKYIQLGWKQAEIARKLGWSEQAIYEDMIIIKQENEEAKAQSKDYIFKDVEALIEAIAKINKLDEELWKIYYGIKVRPTTITEKVEGVDVIKEVDETYTINVDEKLKLEVARQLQQNNLDRAKFEAMLNPNKKNQDTVLKVELMIPNVVERIARMALEFIPKESQVEFLTKIQNIDYAKEEISNDNTRTESKS